MKFNKKAAMELGISTVVMLVIAIVIIGGGIAFIRGFLEKGTDSLDNSFKMADFGLEPSNDDPLVLIDGTVSVKTGRTEIVRIGFYNKQGGSKNVSVGFGGCITTVPATSIDSACGTGVLPKPKINVLPQEVEVGVSVPFGTQVSAKCDGTESENLPAGTYTCSLVVFECAGAVETCITEKYNSSTHADKVLERKQIIFEVRS